MIEISVPPWSGTHWSGTGVPPGPSFQPAFPQKATATLHMPAEMASAALTSPVLGDPGSRNVSGRPPNCEAHACSAKGAVL